MALPALLAGVGVYASVDHSTGRPQVAESATGLTAHNHAGSQLDAGATGDRADDRQRAVGRPQSLAPRPAPPARVAIPAVGIDASVRPMATRGDSFVIPPPGVAGWYGGGPRPGEAGRAILLGHRDTIDGPAVFAGLSDARPGMTVEVRDADGHRRRFAVRSIDSLAKADFPAASTYRPGARRELVLITCGGRFDVTSGHYEDNVIVVAREARSDARRDRAGRTRWRVRALLSR